jgi:hypothetical protein
MTADDLTATLTRALMAAQDCRVAEHSRCYEHPSSPWDDDACAQSRDYAADYLVPTVAALVEAAEQRGAQHERARLTDAWNRAEEARVMALNEALRPSVDPPGVTRRAAMSEREGAGRGEG